tara:strand:+ start:1587 stop:2099 length:513 start_codon:yes stop_codon:yes gene_type:complete
MFNDTIESSMISNNIIGPKKVNPMSPTFLAQNVIEIAANAETKRRALREKHNIDAHQPLESPEYLRETRHLADPLVEYLNQFELTELKKLHMMAMLGAQPDRLQEGSRSLKDVFQDLELTPPGTPPHRGDKKSYIAFFKSDISRLPAFLTDSFNICRKYAIDPDKELAEI